ncbi:MAG: DUF4340 domain-containing protein [Candidatus Binatia bacterium]
MKLWRTLVLALFAAGFGSYLYYIEKPRMEAEEQATRLLVFDASEVEALRLSYPDGLAIGLERQGTNWTIIEPLRTKADSTVVDRLVTAIHDAKVERRMDSDEVAELKVYGLEGDGTQARVELRVAGNTLPAIVVGDTTPVGFQAFVRVEGSDQVMVTPLLFHSGVKKSLFDLREKRLFAVDTRNAVGMSLEGSSGNFVLERAGDDWLISSPVSERADADLVRNLLASLGGIRALAFIDDGDIDEEAFGLTEPSLRVTVRLGDGTQAGFALGGAASDQASEGLYLQRQSDGQVATVAQDVVAKFDKNLGELRDKTILGCDPTEVRAMNFERADGQGFRLYVDDDNKWHILPAAEGRLLKESQIIRARRNLAELAAKEIVNGDGNDPAVLARYGLDEPTVQVEMFREDGTTCGSAMARAMESTEGDTRYYFKRTDSTTIMTAPEYLFSRMDLRPDDVLSARPIDGSSEPSTP